MWCDAAGVGWWQQGCALCCCCWWRSGQCRVPYKPLKLAVCSGCPLAVGELCREQYQQLKDAGADRYLLRIESSNPELYANIHPPAQVPGHAGSPATAAAAARVLHVLRCLVASLGLQRSSLASMHLLACPALPAEVGEPGSVPEGPEGHWLHGERSRRSSRSDCTAADGGTADAAAADTDTPPSTSNLQAPCIHPRPPPHNNLPPASLLHHPAFPAPCRSARV